MTGVRSEHAVGGMLNGGRVRVRTFSSHGITVHRGRIVAPPTSTPAAHMVMDVEVDDKRTVRTVRRLIFCSAIEWIEAVEDA